MLSRDFPPPGHRVIDLGKAPRSVSRRMGSYLRCARHLSPGYAAEWVSERIDRRQEAWLLDRARAAHDTVPSEEDSAPLVTARVITYNRPDILVDRCLPSLLRQTYRNLEILIVGDNCEPSTGRALAAIQDSRVRYINLPRHTIYPLPEIHRWHVAGYAPANLALTLAEGSWLAPCDDDDEFTDDHVEVLLSAARRKDLEFVHSRTAVPVGAREWVVIGRERPQLGHISHGSVLYSARLDFIKYRGTCHHLGEPFDWNLWRRMQNLGVRMGYLDDVTYIYHPSVRTLADFKRRFRVLSGGDRT